MTPADSTQLKEWMRNLAASVTVITALDAAGRPVGATVSSFASLSLEPPLVLACLSSTSRTVEAIRHRKSFAVHLLEGTQEALARRFAADQAEKFEPDGHEFATSAAPALKDCRARLLCSLYSEYEGGDHRIFVGRVEELSCPDDFVPLIHQNRGFWRLGPSLP